MFADLFLALIKLHLELLSICKQNNYCVVASLNMLHAQTDGGLGQSPCVILHCI